MYFVSSKLFIVWFRFLTFKQGHDQNYYGQTIVLKSTKFQVNEHGILFQLTLSASIQLTHTDTDEQIKTALGYHILRLFHSMFYFLKPKMETRD